MKTFLALALALTPLFALGQQSSALAFPDAKIENAPLALLDAAKQALPPVFGATTVPTIQSGRRTGNSRRAISNMPVVSPADIVKYHLQIVKPDESVDYKLTVKAPEIESSK